MIRICLFFYVHNDLLRHKTQDFPILNVDKHDSTDDFVLAIHCASSKHGKADVQISQLYILVLSLLDGQEDVGDLLWSEASQVRSHDSSLTTECVSPG